ncbi:hypothetical protein E2C01_065258 [Portunus trituberculatus]|uniref:Uncharacterized protein n=1 Tax=Portunus trituberculatus TaxID=210409 RepID=A0A5B7HID3_PORTR|nr:hypothetical protein [Portunus trituberculatus]
MTSGGEVVVVAGVVVVMVVVAGGMDREEEGVEEELVKAVVAAGGAEGAGCTCAPEKPGLTTPEGASTCERHHSATRHRSCAPYILACPTHGLN